MRIRHTARRPAILITLLAAISVATASTQGRRFYDDDPIAREPTPRMPREAQPWDVGLFYDLTVNLFVTAGTYAVEHPRAERQHHRRGARLELVHQSRRERRAARTARARPQCRSAAGAGEVGDHPREGGGIRARFHRP